MSDCKTQTAAEIRSAEEFMNCSFVDKSDHMTTAAC